MMKWEDKEQAVEEERTRWRRNEEEEESTKRARIRGDEGETEEAEEVEWKENAGSKILCYDYHSNADENTQ